MPHLCSGELSAEGLITGCAFPGVLVRNAEPFLTCTDMHVCHCCCDKNMIYSTHHVLYPSLIKWISDMGVNYTKMNSNFKGTERGHQLFKC